MANLKQTTLKTKD